MKGVKEFFSHVTIFTRVANSFCRESIFPSSLSITTWLGPGSGGFLGRLESMVVMVSTMSLRSFLLRMSSSLLDDSSSSSLAIASWSSW